MDYRGSTALVTGASGGIGAAFAEELAARGADVVLVARSAETLAALAARLHTDHGVRAEVVAADLTGPDAADTVYEEVARRGMRVDLLVNNAGFGSAGRFGEIPVGRSRTEITLDVTALVELTRVFLPDMAARGRGGVLNVASIAGFQPTPYMAVYGAAKAFVLSFSRALWAEYRGSGVRVTAVCPGPVRTGFADRLGTPPPYAGQFRSAPQVVRTALRAYERGRHTVTPGIVNAALGYGRLLPVRATLGLARYLTGRVVGDSASPELAAAPH